MEEKNIKLQLEVRQYVHSTGRWYKFFGVVGIVMSALMVLGAVAMFVSGDKMEETLYGTGYIMPAWVYGVVYLVTTLLMIPMIIYMFRGAKAAAEASGLHNNEAAVRFLRETKRYWKFYGILYIVILGICALALVGGVVAVVLSVL